MRSHSDVLSKYEFFENTNSVHLNRIKNPTESKDEFRMNIKFQQHCQTQNQYLVINDIPLHSI